MFVSHNKMFITHWQLQQAVSFYFHFLDAKKLKCKELFAKSDIILFCLKGPMPPILMVFFTS